MMSMLLHTLIFYFFAGIAVLVALPPLLIGLLFSNRYDSRYVYGLLSFLYRGLCWALRVPIQIVGAENIASEPAIIVANHQSIFDIPLVGLLLRSYPHLWFYKHELNRVPVLGFLARRLGIPVDRRFARSGARSMLEALRLMQGRQRHVILFPEGSRFSDGKIHPFLLGYALLAEKTARPVVPVYIEDTYKICPMGSFSVSYAPVRLVVGPQFLIGSHESLAEFNDRVHAWFDEQPKR